MPVKRYSRQRELIYRTLKASHEHPTAEMIYQALKPTNPNLSLGTVYRNLALFRESGEVVCVATVRGADRLDACTEPHAHFICEQCGAVLDVDVPQDDLRSDLETRYGVRVRRSELLFRGVCSACRETS